MIDEICVENLALIRKASLVPCAGLTVLTGETGAGKTALLSACKLLMGERADKSLVRDGEAALMVSGRFFSSKDVERVDEYTAQEQQETLEKDCNPDTGELVALRRVTTDGRSRVTLNGTMASVGELAHAIAPSIDLCGQHEHQQLMCPASHASILDTWAKETITEAKEAYTAAFLEAQAAQEALDKVHAAVQESEERLADARFTLQRIDEVSPQEDEYAHLAATLTRAEHAETLARVTTETYETLSGDAGALDMLGKASALLDSAVSYDSALGKFARLVREASYVVEDVAHDVRLYRDGVDFDADNLVQMQERMNALQGLLRVFGPRMEDVFAARLKAAELVSCVDDATERKAQAQRACDIAEAALIHAADVFDAARAEAAPRFATAVAQQLDRLEMGGAQLSYSITRLERRRWTKDSPSSVEFLFKSAASMQPRPFIRIASGGEISRVMLAIKVVLGHADCVDTLIFDEVDAGVGGAVARSLALVLADLARTHQVIVVTHLAQVAVQADVHYVVTKTEGEMPETLLQEVGGEARVAEIARMLSGSTTEASLMHARELLSAARSQITNTDDFE